MQVVVEMTLRSGETALVSGDVSTDRYGQLVVSGVRAVVGGEVVGLRARESWGAECRLRMAYRLQVVELGAAREAA